MSLHINKFIDRIRAAESRTQREFTMTMSEARDLHADISKLLLALEVLREEKMSNTKTQEITTIEVQGGTF